MQMDLLPASVRSTARTLSVIGHGELRRLLRQIEREPPVEPGTPPTPHCSHPWPSHSAAGRDGRGRSSATT